VDSLFSICGQRLLSLIAGTGLIRHVAHDGIHSQNLK